MNRWSLLRAEGFRGESSNRAKLGIWLLFAAGGLAGIALLPRALAADAGPATVHAGTATAHAGTPTAHAGIGTANSTSDAAVEQRMAAGERYLASKQLEGRGPGTHGIDLAADYIAREFKQAGLKTDLFDGQPFQKFTIASGSKLGPAEHNHVELIGPARAAGQARLEIPLKLGVDFNPLALGGSAKIDAPLVFAGYGITAKKEKYDDYAGIDVKDKAVIVLRHQPQRANPHGLFGNRDAIYAALSRKISNAYEHGAAAIVFCTDDLEVENAIAGLKKRWQAARDEAVKADQAFQRIASPSPDQIVAHAKLSADLTAKAARLTKELAARTDPVMKFNRGGEENQGREFPVLHCRRAALDRMVKAALGTDLAGLEAEIDVAAVPHSRPLTGWRIVGETNLIRQRIPLKNVLGILEGEGPHADETIVIGAHYDHLGYGGWGSLAPGVHAIHQRRPTTMRRATYRLLEIARELAGRPKKLPRRIRVHRLQRRRARPVGQRLLLQRSADPARQDDRHAQHGHGRPDERRQVDHPWQRHVAAIRSAHRSDQRPLRLQDHSPAGRLRPQRSFLVLREEYPGAAFLHRHAQGLSSTERRLADKINVPGMRRVAEMVEKMAVALAEADARPAFAESKVSSVHILSQDSERPYFGSIPDFGQEQPGYAITGVTKGSPAENARAQGGRHDRSSRRKQDRQSRGFRQRFAKVSCGRQSGRGREAWGERVEAGSDARPSAIAVYAAAAAMPSQLAAELPRIPWFG